MVEFEKGHWNINELRIVDWIDPKTEGFINFDVKTLKKKLLEDIEAIFDEGEVTEEDVLRVIVSRFGF